MCVCVCVCVSIIICYKYITYMNSMVPCVRMTKGCGINHKYTNYMQVLHCKLL